MKINDRLKLCNVDQIKHPEEEGIEQEDLSSS